MLEAVTEEPQLLEQRRQSIKQAWQQPWLETHAESMSKIKKATQRMTFCSHSEETIFKETEKKDINISSTRAQDRLKQTGK